ncbi:hypothetical protein HU200_040617 [Digitaria exilis]|uniref:Uncharacterized protein n=1 Tax=Digitaria exilis TaxID=1010633 RepID=A0A835B948_9POAL|nr:hypothetical protein HU200_040617 [Digitaria exilis]
MWTCRSLLLMSRPRTLLNSIRGRVTEPPAVALGAASRWLVSDTSDADGRHNDTSVRHVGEPGTPATAGRSPPMATGDKKHLYLLLDDAEYGFGIHKLDMDTDVAAGGLDSVALPRLPDPPVLRFDDKWIDGFAVLGSNVIGVALRLTETHPDSRSDGDTVIFDTRTSKLTLLADLPNGLRDSCPMLSIAAGDRLYVIEAGTVYDRADYDNKFFMGGLHSLQGTDTGKKFGTGGLQSSVCAALPSMRATCPPSASDGLPSALGSTCQAAASIDAQRTRLDVSSCLPPPPPPTIQALHLLRKTRMILMPCPAAAKERPGAQDSRTRMGRRRGCDSTVGAEGRRHSIYLPSDQREPGWCWHVIYSSSTRWFWSCDPQKLPFLPYGVTAHAVHPSERAFFVSAYCHRGRGTFSYNTERGDWTRHGDGWELPFIGQSHYDQDLNAWVGLHVQRDGHGSFMPDGHICACDLPDLDGPAATPEWKLGKEKLFVEDPERHVDAKIVGMGGGGRFCVVEIMTMPGVDRKECIGDGDKCVLRLTAFRVEYDDDGELTVTDRRPARSQATTLTNDDIFPLLVAMLAPSSRWHGPSTKRHGPSTVQSESLSTRCWHRHGTIIGPALKKPVKSLLTPPAYSHYSPPLPSLSVSPPTPPSLTPPAALPPPPHQHRCRHLPHPTPSFLSHQLVASFSCLRRLPALGAPATAAPCRVQAAPPPAGRPPPLEKPAALGGAPVRPLCLAAPATIEGPQGLDFLKDFSLWRLAGVLLGRQREPIGTARTQSAVEHGDPTLSTCFPNWPHLSVISQLPRGSAPDPDSPDARARRDWRVATNPSAGNGGRPASSDWLRPCALRPWRPGPRVGCCCCVLEREGRVRPCAVFRETCTGAEHDTMWTCRSLLMMSRPRTLLDLIRRRVTDPPAIVLGTASRGLVFDTNDGDGHDAKDKAAVSSPGSNPRRPIFSAWGWMQLPGPGKFGQAETKQPWGLQQEKGELPYPGADWGGLHCLKLQQDDDDDTVAHGYRKYEHGSYIYSSTRWFWSCDPKEIPLTPDGITAHAVHPSGRAFFVSVHCYRVDDHRGRGTFSYHTEHGYWTRHGDWELPFVGQAHYDHGLNAWVGLHHVQSDGHRGFMPDGHICACDVPGLDGAAAPDWKLGKEKLGTSTPSSLAWIMTMPGVDREECVGDGEKCVLRLTVFRVMYNDDVELIVTDRRPSNQLMMKQSLMPEEKWVAEMGRAQIRAARASTTTHLLPPSPRPRRTPCQADTLILLLIITFVGFSSSGTNARNKPPLRLVATPSAFRLAASRGTRRRNVPCGAIRRGAMHGVFVGTMVLDTRPDNNENENEIFASILFLTELLAVTKKTDDD